MKKDTKHKIIIDTDPGHDDALAIMLLEKSCLFDIQAITTVAGNSSIEKVTNNARYILNLLNCEYPLYSGAPKPLNRELANAVISGEGNIDGAPSSSQEPLTETAVEKIISIVYENPREVSIVVIGPQTNIAQAFIKAPELPSLIKQLVIMGGAITAPGNKNRVAEFNIFIDPEAAEIVLRANVKKILIPLDVCNKIILQITDFKKIKGSKLYQPILKMMDKYINHFMSGEKVAGALMYDSLAAYYLINPAAYNLELMDIEVETKSDLTRGMTVVERRTWVEKNLNVFVAKSINKHAFTKDFLEILKS